MGALLREAHRRELPLRSSTTVVARAWRGGARQAELARQLPAIDQIAFDVDAARSVGSLLGAAGTADVVDGHLAQLVRAGDLVLTADAGRIAPDRTGTPGFAVSGLCED